jgi:hypothetical protein
MYMKKHFFLLTLFLMLTGCGRQIENFVGSEVPLPGSADLPSQSTSQPNAIKISPGANLVTGAQVQSRFAITPSQVTAQGAQVKTTFSLHQNRPN